MNSGHESDIRIKEKVNDIEIETRNQDMDFKVVEKGAKAYREKADKSEHENDNAFQILSALNMENENDDDNRNEQKNKNYEKKVKVLNAIIQNLDEEMDEMKIGIENANE